MISTCSMTGILANIGVLLKPRQSQIVRMVIGVKAIALGLLAQLLMFGLEMAVELSSFPFPSSILAMFLLFVFLLALGCCWDGLQDFYIKHLRQPVSLSQLRATYHGFCLGPSLT